MNHESGLDHNERARYVQLITLHKLNATFLTKLEVKELKRLHKKRNKPVE